MNRRNIPLNPPIFSREGSYIILRPFNNNYSFSEEFELKPKEKTSIIIKDTVLDLYINSLKVLQRLIYYKEPIFKENRVTIENIVNLRQMKYKKRKKEKKIDNNTVFKERVEKLGINYDNLLQFESHFESGNLQLAYITESIDEIKNFNNNINKNKNNDNENNLNNSINNNNKNININSSINNDINKDVNFNMINDLKKEEIERYELFLHNDTNTSGYTQWFFFRISNIKKGKKINLNIMNFLRKKTKYSNGIKIWCYSRKDSEINKIGWHHTTEEVKYYKNFLYKLNKGRKDYYYTLSFNYTFKYDNDEVFFANCIPFTYTDVTRDLNFYTKNENDKYIFFDRKKLCSTIIGNTVEFFSINNSTIYPYITSNYSNNNKLKNGIVLFGRQHPSETVGSWTLKGAIDFLMGESDEAKYLRDNFIFKIIPMINVDGVICGNTRTSLSGCDLNRRWSNPNLLLHPEIFYAKEMIIEFCKKYTIECIVDFHGHFGAFNSFFYGNHKEDNFSSCRYFPFTCAKKSKVIQFEKSKFRMPKYKRGTGRINLFKELNVENVVTLETSYFGCNTGGYINQYFNVDTLQEIGRDICNGILLFHYHSSLQMGINNDLNSYPFLQKKVENDEKIINSQFTEYLNKFKNEIIEENKKEEIEENKLNNIKNQNENEKNNIDNENDDKNKDNNGGDNDNDNDDDYLNDDVTDSESDPSGDNLDESEIIKLLPPPKKLKKIIRKNFKKKKLNKRNPLRVNHNNIINNNINNIYMNNNINIRYNNNINNNILHQKNSNNNINNLNLFSLPKLKDSFKKNKFNIQNLYNSIDVNSKSRKDISSFDEDNYKLNPNNSSLNKNGKDISSKNILFKINPTSPNVNNIKPNNLNFNINISINTNLETSDKATQTEEIFFKSNWKHFIGMYKILTPKIDKYPVLCQLKPIKFNAIKNSYSFTNKNDVFLNNSVFPPPQTVDTSNPKRFKEHKILNMMKYNKFNFDNNINNKINRGNRNSSMIPFGPVYNNLMDKSNNNENIIFGNINNINRINVVNLKSQKIMSYPPVKSKDIFLKKLNEKKEN